MADDVLRLAGFVEGVNYRKQTSVERGRGIPDFTFLLPERAAAAHGREVPARQLPAATSRRSPTSTASATATTSCATSAGTCRSSPRATTSTRPSGTVDFVLLFIPNEQLYAFIHEHDAAILDDALGAGSCSARR